MILQFFFAAKANDLKVTKQTSRVGNEHFRPISNPFTGNSARRAPRHGPRTGQPRCSPARERAAGGAPGAAVAGKIRRAAAIIPDHRGITARANGLPGWRADAAASQVVIDMENNVTGESTSAGASSVSRYAPAECAIAGADGLSGGKVLTSATA